MKKMKILHGGLILMLAIALSACNPKISTSIIKSYPMLDYQENVMVIGLEQQVPDSAEVIGRVKVGDSGFSTNCNYDLVIDKAKLEARKAGGNAIKITKHTPPSIMGSSCHRITANILKVKNLEYLSEKEEEEILEDVDYVVLNVYRYGGTGSLVNYDLYLGDSIICRIKNNYKTTLHLKKEGLNTLWAKTEAKSEVPVDLKFGKQYYLRCGVTMGAFVGRPELELIDIKTGKVEFESFKAKNQ